jgi:hypothetical protein
MVAAALAEVCPPRRRLLVYAAPATTAVRTGEGTGDSPDPIREARLVESGEEMAEESLSLLLTRGNMLDASRVGTRELNGAAAAAAVVVVAATLLVVLPVAVLCIEVAPPVAATEWRLLLVLAALLGVLAGAAAAASAAVLDANC